MAIFSTTIYSVCLSYFVFLRTFFAPFCFVRAEFYSPVHKKTRGGCAFAQPPRVTGFPSGGSCPLCVSPFQGFPFGGSCPLCVSPFQGFPFVGKLSALRTDEGRLFSINPSSVAYATPSPQGEGLLPFRHSEAYCHSVILRLAEESNPFRSFADAQDDVMF